AGRQYRSPNHLTSFGSITNRSAELPPSVRKLVTRAWRARPWCNFFTRSGTSSTTSRKTEGKAGPSMPAARPWVSTLPGRGTRSGRYNHVRMTRIELNDEQRTEVQGEKSDRTPAGAGHVRRHFLSRPHPAHPRRRRPG